MMLQSMHDAYKVISVIIIFLASCQSTSIESKSKRASDDLKIVCYYSNWAVYRPGLAKFTPQNINPYLCTHLIYAFAGLSSKYELKAFDPYNDINQGNYKKFVGLKAYNNQLKTLIAVGGWNEGSKRFSKLVASPELRLTFIKSALKFLREHNFDGLDLDWEYPGFREGSSGEDREGYSQFIRELRAAFDDEKLSPGKERLLLSVAVPAGQEYIDQGFDVPAVSQNVDFLNVLSYDYHTAFDPETNHHAPLFKVPEVSRFAENNKLNADWTINYYIENGAPRHKLILGIPTYGRSYTLADPNKNEIAATAEGPGEAGPSTREKGYLAFYEICQKIQEEGWQVKRQNPKIAGPYAYKDNQWVSFDDAEIVKEKARFINEKGLGGAMIWTLDNDDFRGLCAGEQSPIITALRTELFNTVNNVVLGSSSEHTRLVRPAQSSFQSSITENRRQQFNRRLHATTTTTSTTTTTEKPTTTTVKDIIRTPEPPPTPDPGPAFECEDEGFFSNPKDCKKYFWCLDSGPANLGIVPHAFTCPSGLYFNTKTEACDYPENVSCKQKSKHDDTRKPKSKSKSTTTTTTTTTTTSTTTTTEAPKLSGQDLNNELLSNLLKQLNIAQQTGNNNNVAQLLQLVQSLGGAERIQSLINSNNLQPQSDTETFNRIPSPATTNNFYAPSYVTPNRQTDNTLPPETTVTESVFAPPSAASGVRLGLPQNQVRPRRPQFDQNSHITTTNPFIETPRNNANNRLLFNQPQPFSFIYNTPGGRDSTNLDGINSDGNLLIRHDFNHNNQLRSLNSSDRSQPQSSTSRLVFATEPTTRFQDFNNNAYRVPVRVSPRVPSNTNSLETSNVNVRRPNRQRAFANDKSGVFYDEEAEQTLPPPSIPSNSITTERSVRRRPPNRYNIRTNNNNENPVSTLINLPPRANPTLIERPQERPQVRPQLSPQVLPPHQPLDHIFVTPPSELTTQTTTQNALFNIFRSPQSPRFTNFNTLPPEFDIAPFTTAISPFFEISHTTVTTSQPTTFTTTAVSTTTTTTPRPTVRRNQFGPPRGRRPIPQSTTQATTSTPRPTRRQTTEAATIPPEKFDGPSVFAENNGNLGCSKRGVYAHPSNCGMFVVCAPASRSNKTLRSYTHHCPAEQVFVQEIGRCRPGNKDKCEVFS